MADWLGEAELTPGRDGKIPPHHVLYSREKDRIDKPENADAYVGRLDAGARLFDHPECALCGHAEGSGEDECHAGMTLRTYW